MSTKRTIKHCTRHISHSPAELTYREGKVYITKFRRRSTSQRAQAWPNGKISIQKKSQDQKTKSRASSLLSVHLATLPLQEAIVLPGVDGSAATSGLIEFLFATFLDQKWDVVVAGVLPFLLLHGPAVIFPGLRARG